MSSGGFTIIDFTVPTRDSPVVHACSEAPICDDCRSEDLCFFDPTCSGCQDVLSNPKTTISELFAIMRQWIPQTQRHLSLLTREILRRGAHINDKDGLTDLCLLHFASKAGAAGMSNGETAANLVNTLINKGADTDLKCHWTDMNALHYAVFFDCHDVVDRLCQHNPALVISICSQFQGGNALHIAAANLCLGSAKILLKHNGDAGYKDNNNLLPHECVPEVVSKKEETIANELRDILQEASLNRPQIKSRPLPKSRSSSPPQSGSTRSPISKAGKATPTSTAGKSQKPEINGDTSTIKISQASKVDAKPHPPSRQDSKGSHPSSQPSPDTNSPLVHSNSPAPSTSTLPSTTASNSPEEVTLETLGVKIGDRVVVDPGNSKSKKGTLRFAGETMFASGQWAGIELDDEVGRNDGSHGGIRYFSCKPKRGLFVHLKRIIKDSSTTPPTTSSAGSGSSVKGKKTVTSTLSSDLRVRSESFVTARAIEAHSDVQMSSEFQVGDRVIVSGKNKGILRYAGAVKFAPGFWLGIELDHSRGTCDGTKGGKEYFKCQPNHGIFVLPSKVSKIIGKDSIDLPSSGGSCSPSPNPPVSTPSNTRRRRLTPNSASKSTLPSKSYSSFTSPVPTSLSLATAPDITLEKGMSVFVNKEKGTVQYIGHTDFAPGVWLGVEFRKPSGKNDGSVNGKRYFSCKPNYGIFVKPEKATHRGINCAKLLKIDK